MITEKGDGKASPDGRLGEEMSRVLGQGQVSELGAYLCQSPRGEGHWDACVLFVAAAAFSQLPTQGCVKQQGYSSSAVSARSDFTPFRHFGPDMEELDQRLVCLKPRHDKGREGG